jgi:hypothetical protein
MANHHRRNAGRNDLLYNAVSRESRHALIAVAARVDDPRDELQGRLSDREKRILTRLGGCAFSKFEWEEP